MKRLAVFAWGCLIASSMVLQGCAAVHPKATRGDWVTVKDREGREWRAYAAGPPEAGAAVLVVHDYFGISAFTRATVEHLAAQGYRALAIDLYRGKTATAHEPAVALMQAYQTQDRRIGDAALQAGVDALKRPGRRIATLGFSMGGAESLRAARNDPQTVDVSVVAYGFGFDTWPCEQWSWSRGHVLLVTGALDEGALHAALGLAKTSCADAPLAELHVLPRVGHAFAQPLFNAGQGHDPGATEAMWQIVDGYLQRRLRATQQTK